MESLQHDNPGEHEFHQAVREVVHSVMPVVLEHPEYQKAKILERLVEPDRIVTFRVCWEDDDGHIQVNRAWRVQFSNAIGPYKGGLRFHPTVNQSVLKFLGFEQVFKNSLTGLPMGGAKGGSNFDPKGRSDREVMRFCQSLMVELHRHIGEDTDIPAGDIGVGAREISLLFGMYKRLSNRFVGTLTGKGLAFGGSLVRREATGYGAVYFLRCMLSQLGEGLRGKTASVSGAGNVALYAVEKLLEEGAKVLTVSDSRGTLYDPDGIDEEKLEHLKNLKEGQRAPLSEYLNNYPKAEFRDGERPWKIPVQVALPCATQNELEGPDAQALIDNGVMAVAEGANMPSTFDAVELFRSHRIPFGPGKAANAGGVAVSGLEQSQNALRISWSREEVDQRLRGIMTNIHARCLEEGRRPEGHIDYVDGANRAGFKKVAEALTAYGVV